MVNVGIQTIQIRIVQKKEVDNMTKNKIINTKLAPEKRPIPIPQSCIISNKYYDLKHGGKSGRRARKMEVQKLINE